MVRRPFRAPGGTSTSCEVPWSPWRWLTASWIECGPLKGMATPSETRMVSLNDHEEKVGSSPRGNTSVTQHASRERPAECSEGG